jgi:hypothetical protein
MSSFAKNGPGTRGCRVPRPASKVQDRISQRAQAAVKVQHAVVGILICRQEHGGIGNFFARPESFERDRPCGLRAEVVAEVCILR